MASDPGTTWRLHESDAWASQALQVPIGNRRGIVFLVRPADMRTANHMCQECGASFVAGSWAYQTLDAKVSYHVECVSAGHHDDEVEQRYAEDVAQIRATGSLFDD